MGGPNLALFTFPLENYELEIGADYEHAFSENFDVKLIALYGLETETFESGFEFLPAMGAGDRSVFLSDETSGETIGRIEFAWNGWKGHAIQFGGEIARNFIDSEAELLTDDGMGGLMPVVLDGANTRVAEIRGETFITDSWAISPKLKLDIGMKVEFSRIAQSGDNANSRFFTYPKPSLVLTYNLAEKSQIRLSAERTVNQLSFGQFVSSVNFDDEDVDFGNPDLQPQRLAGEAGAEDHVGAATLAISFKGIARHARTEEHEVVEVGHRPLRAEPADLVDAFPRRALDLVDRGAVEDVGFPQVGRWLGHLRSFRSSPAIAGR